MVYMIFMKLYVVFLTDWYRWDDKVNGDDENDEVISQNALEENERGSIDLQTPSVVLSPQRLAERKPPDKSNRNKDSSLDQGHEEQVTQSGEVTLVGNV